MTTLFGDVAGQPHTTGHEVPHMERSAGTGLVPLLGLLVSSCSP